MFPLIEVVWQGVFASRRGECAPLVVVPKRRCAGEALFRKLLEGEDAALRQEGRDLVDGAREVLDVVQRNARDDGIEAARIRKFLEPDSPEDQPFRRIGVDRDDLEASLGESLSKLSPAAADLEHTDGRRRQLSAQEVTEGGRPPRHRLLGLSSKPSSVARTRGPIVWSM